MSVPVVVLGAGITALGVIRTLGRAGIQAYLVGDNGSPAPHSRWYRRLETSFPPAPEPGALAAWLSSLPLARAVLMPCSDHWVHAVAGLPPSLFERFPASIAPLDAIEALVNKARFCQLLEQEHLPHPRTRIVEAPEQLSGLGDTDFENAFLKPCDSQQFSRSFGVKAFAVTDREHANQQLTAALGCGTVMLLQEYVPGPPSAHYFVDGFIDRNGQLSACFARRRWRMHPPDFGNSSFHVSMPLADVSGAVDTAVKLAEVLGYRGIFSAEFKFDARDGLFKILEVNARPWWYIEFAARSGVDVCTMAYRDALGLSVKPVHDYEVGRGCVTLDLDVKAFRRLRNDGKLGLWPWLTSWIGADHPILSWSDPGPGAWMAAQMLASQARKLLMPNGRGQPAGTPQPDRMMAAKAAASGKSTLAQPAQVTRSVTRGRVQTRFLAESEYSRWSSLVALSPEGSIYSTPEYLDVLCAVTGARFRILVAERAGELAGGIGLYERRCSWGTYVSPRLLLYYNGLVLRPQTSKYPSERSAHEVETLSVLEQALRTAGYGRLILKNRSTLHDIRPFLARGWKAWPSYTYVVPIKDLQAAWERVEQNLRRLIQRCTREGLTLTDDDDFDSFYQMHHTTHERKGSSLYLPEAGFRIYFEKLKAANLCRLFHARLPEGRSLAAQLVLLGPHPTSHTVCAGADPEFLRTGASAFLRWKVFEQLSKLGYMANDLTDAALNPVTHFKSQLGGDLAPCFNLRASEGVGFRLESSASQVAASTRSGIGAIARRLGLRRPN